MQARTCFPIFAEHRSPSVDKGRDKFLMETEEQRCKYDSWRLMSSRRTTVELLEKFSPQMEIQHASYSPC